MSFVALFGWYETISKSNGNFLDTPGMPWELCSKYLGVSEERKDLPGLRKLRSLSLDGNVVDFEQWCLALQAREISWVSLSEWCHLWFEDVWSTALHLLSFLFRPCLKTLKALFNRIFFVNPWGNLGKHETAWAGPAFIQCWVYLDASAGTSWIATLVPSKNTDGWCGCHATSRGGWQW